jgi:hypothetical protein
MLDYRRGFLPKAGDDWTRTGDSGDVAMMEVFDEVVAPAAARFQPDIILVSDHSRGNGLMQQLACWASLPSSCGTVQVSAGYDAHWRDPLASLQMRSSTYYRLAAKIKQLADTLSGMHQSSQQMCWVIQMACLPGQQQDIMPVLSPTSCECCRRQVCVSIGGRL